MMKIKYLWVGVTYTSELHHHCGERYVAELCQLSLRNSLLNKKVCSTYPLPMTQNIKSA